MLLCVSKRVDLFARAGLRAIMAAVAAMAIPDSPAEALTPHLLTGTEARPVLHRVQADAGFSEVTDRATGVRTNLPLGIVSGPYGAAWGSNWRASDNRLNIDTLNFRHERTLSSVYQKLRSIKGRKISNDSYDGSQFVLQGTDSDGTLFLVQCADRGGEVRGISIVYSKWARSELEPVVVAIVHSLDMFPGPSSPPSYNPPPLAYVQPPTPAPPPELGSNPEIKNLQEQFEALQNKIKTQEEESRRRDEEQKQATRDDEIRRSERERAEEEARKVQQKLQAEIDRLLAEQKKTQPPASTGVVESTSPMIGRLPPGKRVAFVVGINTYRELAHQDQLQRAVNDARLMHATLSQLGFEVLPVAENTSRREFAQSWQQYLKKIEPGSTAAFFFAGHGVQMQGVNYLLPSDVPALPHDSPELLQLEALNFNNLYSDILARKPKVSLLILDACRDNPFALAFGRGVGGQRGLTTVKPVEGSFVLYSANADEQALDRLPNDGPDEGNSVFTRTLAPMLLKSNMTLQEVARQVRRNVANLAGQIGHKQWPSYYDGLTGNVCLAGSCAPEAVVDKN